jgi:hypothetical protein
VFYYVHTRLTMQVLKGLRQLNIIFPSIHWVSKWSLLPIHFISPHFLWMKITNVSSCNPTLMNASQYLIKDKFQKLVRRWRKYNEQVRHGARVKATGSLNILCITTRWCILRLQMVITYRYSIKWWIHWIKTVTGRQSISGPSDLLCKGLTNLNLKS